MMSHRSGVHYGDLLVLTRTEDWDRAGGGRTLHNAHRAPCVQSQHLAACVVRGLHPSPSTHPHITCILVNADCTVCQRCMLHIQGILGRQWGITAKFSWPNNTFFAVLGAPNLKWVPSFTCTHIFLLGCDLLHRWCYMVLSNPHFCCEPPSFRGLSLGIALIYLTLWTVAGAALSALCS